MKTKIEPINLVCHNNELVDIDFYQLKENLFKVKDNNSKLSFCFYLDKMNPQSILYSDLINDKKYYLKLIKKGIIENHTEKIDSFYMDLLITKISDILEHLNTSYGFKQN